MASIPYDEKHLMEQLELLPPERRVAFAAACAERLAPAYAAYSTRTGRGDPAKLACLLDRLWADLAGDRMTEGDMQASIDASMALITQEEEHPWVVQQWPAEDAATAVAYALQCRQSAKSQEAAWAAGRVYDALDDFIVNRDDPPDGKVHGLTHPEAQAQLARVLADPLVQAELARQERDLGELLAAREDDGPAVIARLRDRARAEARSLFG